MKNKINLNLNKIKKFLSKDNLYKLKKVKFKINQKFKTLKSFKDKSFKDYLEFSQDQFNKLQDNVEGSFKKISFDESLLKQSSFWFKSVTWALIGTSSFAFLWLCFAKTDEVVITTGKLDPKGDVKDIQIPLGGVIDEILVKSGENVESGQILIQLDKEASFEKFRSLEIAIFEKQFQLEKIASILKLKKAELLQESKIIDELISNTSEKININYPILEDIKFLYEEGAISKLQYIEKKMELDELNSELIRLGIERDKAINLISQDIEQLESEEAKMRTEISSLNSELTSAKVTLKYQSIESPVSGIVFDLKPTAEGYVAQSSEPIMKIVPFDDLEADIEIPSNKIGFVKVGAPVEISIDSFPSTDFGVLNGTIKSIGSDALVPSQIEQRPEYRFPAVVQLDEQKLNLKNGESLALQVGMSLQANIKLRKVSYLKLLLGGLTQKIDSLKSF